MKVPRRSVPFFSHSAAFNGYLMDIGGPVDGTNGGQHIFLVTLRPFHFLVNLGLSRQVKMKA